MQYVSNALQTNGFLINEEWCQFFKKNNFLIGVSVDGTKEIHDSYRHSKTCSETYDTIVQNIQLMERYGVEYNILTVVTSKVAENVKNIYHDYKKHRWMYQQYIECLDPIGYQWGSRSYSLRPEAFGRFMTELFELWYEDWKKGEQPYIRKFENYVGILSDIFVMGINIFLIDVPRRWLKWPKQYSGNVEIFKLKQFINILNVSH